MSGDRTVWVVDDDRSIRWVMEKALTQAGLVCQSFETGEALLEAMATDTPDVVISVCDNAADQCPVFPGGGVQRLHWPFDDPADATGTDDQKREVFRRVRDEIRETILEWVA